MLPGEIAVQVFLPRRDLRRCSGFQTWLDRAATMPSDRSSVLDKEAFARSARTRRSIGRPRKARTGGIGQAIA